MVDNFLYKKFNDSEKEVFYDVIFSRRDVRKKFIDKTIDDKTIFKILNADSPCSFSWIFSTMEFYFN